MLELGSGVEVGGEFHLKASRFPLLVIIDVPEDELYW
jgi:hypothetical protein